MLNGTILLGNDRELCFSIILQNVLQPKNSNRTEAIKSGVYKEITTVEQARVYCSELMGSNLKNELLSIESECKNKVAQL